MTPTNAIARPASRKRIKPLPTLLVNQIAAGEVVERPASVVKELVDNAIDAGATHLAIDLERGGVELVRVSDDGSGIDDADLPLAVAPHATSKIEHADDLEAIGTLGFRGEALASIASVSRLSIRSRPKDSDSAYRFDIAGDQASPLVPDSGAVGTVVTVRNLFFNTPVRRKFLKTPATEQSHCVAMIKDLALAQPNLGFALRCDDRLILDLPPMQNPRARAIAILGRELEDQLLEVSSDDLDSPGVAIWGLVGMPAIAKPNARGQHLFVNGRPVRDKTIQHALQEACRGLLDPHRKPVAALLVEMDPSLVDVNVHPAKAEVRFRESGRVHSAVYHAVKRAMDQADLTPIWTDVHHQSSSGERATGDSFAQRGAVVTTGWTPPRQFSAADFASSIKAHLTDAGAEVDYDALRAAVERSAPAAEHHDPPAETLTPVRAADRILQVHDSFIVTSDDEGVLIIDQHALHERVMFEKIMDRLAAGPLESQSLLTPATFAATRAQLDALSGIHETLGRIGVAAGPIGPGAIAVHAFPTLLFDRGVDPVVFLHELLERASASDFPTTEESAIHTVVDMMSCKAAVKAGDHLSDAELSELLALRQRVERSSSCPHGRPTTIRLSLSDLERRFGRR